MDYWKFCLLSKVIDKFLLLTTLNEPVIDLSVWRHVAQRSMHQPVHWTPNDRSIPDQEHRDQSGHGSPASLEHVGIPLLELSNCFEKIRIALRVSEAVELVFAGDNLRTLLDHPYQDHPTHRVSKGGSFQVDCSSKGSRWQTPCKLQLDCFRWQYTR